MDLSLNPGAVLSTSASYFSPGASSKGRQTVLSLPEEPEIEKYLGPCHMLRLLSVFYIIY